MLLATTGVPLKITSTSGALGGSVAPSGVAQLATVAQLVLVPACVQLAVVANAREVNPAIAAADTIASALALANLGLPERVIFAFVPPDIVFPPLEHLTSS